MNEVKEQQKSKQKKAYAAMKKKVMKYIKTLDIKDDNGVKIGSKLINAPRTLLNFYRAPFFLNLKNDEERFLAKVVFKDQIPYKEWAEYISKNPGVLRSLVEDFQEMVDPRYQRKTERGGSVPNI